MQTKRNFYLNVVEVVEGSLGQITKETEEIQKLEKENASGVYSDKRVAENNSKIKGHKDNIERLRISGKAEVERLCEEYKVELRKADALNGNDLTDDAKLLSSGVKLSKKDLEYMLDRNKGNNTMTQLILRYADENGMKMGVYTGNNALIESLKAIPYSAEVCLKWSDRRAIFDKLMGEGSEFEAWADA